MFETVCEIWLFAGGNQSIKTKNFCEVVTQLLEEKIPLFFSSQFLILKNRIYTP
jgi:hypothetical protein